MADSDQDIFKRPPGQLARLVAAVEGKDGQWLKVELGSILRHQLAARAWPANENVNQLDAPIRSFKELFLHLQPPLELLKQTKDFAKAQREHPNSFLPKEVATVLYYASIVAARLRLGERITSLTDAELRQGVEWSLELPWLVESMQPLFTEGLSVLRG